MIKAAPDTFMTKYTTHESDWKLTEKKRKKVIQALSNLREREADEFGLDPLLLSHFQTL